MLTWLASNATPLTILGAVVAFIWPVVQFVLVRRSENRSREFDAYHRLIRELVAPDPGTETIWVQRQIAVIFELRHFPRYYDVTTRILDQLRQKWFSDPDHKWPYVLEEIDLTLAYIGRAHRWSLRSVKSLTPAQEAELDRRLAAHRESPDEGASLEEVKARIQAKK